MHRGVYEFTVVAMRRDTSMTLDASMWNGAVGELSSCVINKMPLDHVL